MSQWAIETTGLTKRFGKTNAVDGLNLQVPEGSVFGFLGRNGAGKTTTIRLLLNLLRPDAGTRRVLGEDPHQRERQIKERIGYVADQALPYGWMRVGQLLHFVGQLYTQWDEDLVGEWTRRFELDQTQKIKTLSKGQNVRLALVLALGHRPDLLILDEPAAGLDVVVRREILQSLIEVIQEEGRTVFFSSHLVHEVERVADRVAIIEAGSLVIADEIDALKMRVRQVRVQVEDDASRLLQVPGVRRLRGEGSERVILVEDYDDSSAAAIAAAGGRIVETSGLGLEDLFVEYVRPEKDGTQ